MHVIPHSKSLDFMGKDVFHRQLANFFPRTVHNTVDER